MKKVLLALALVAAAPLALADSYTVKQFTWAPQYAINVADVGNAVKIEQVAQNVGNQATIKDLDGYGGDSYGSWQKVDAMQFAKNTLTVDWVAKTIDQTAINFGSSLTIKDAGGVGSPQSVVADQVQNGLQHAINKLTINDPTAITQVAANTANTMDINLPSSWAINTVSTFQSVTAPQVAGNFATVPYTASLSQTAANAGNAVTIIQ